MHLSCSSPSQSRMMFLSAWLGTTIWCGVGPGARRVVAATPPLDCRALVRHAISRGDRVGQHFQSDRTEVLLGPLAHVVVDARRHALRLPALAARHCLLLLPERLHSGAHHGEPLSRSSRHRAQAARVARPRPRRDRRCVGGILGGQVPQRPCRLLLGARAAAAHQLDQRRDAARRRDRHLVGGIVGGQDPQRIRAAAAHQLDQAPTAWPRRCQPRLTRAAPCSPRHSAS